MPEKIIFRGLDEPSQHFLISATVIAEKQGLSIKAFCDEAREVHGGSYEVTFLVNGQELPYAATIEEIFRRYESMIDKRAAEKAVEMVRGAGLESLMDTVRDAEWKIREKLREAGFEVEEAN